MLLTGKFRRTDIAEEGTVSTGDPGESQPVQIAGYANVGKACPGETAKGDPTAFC